MGRSKGNSHERTSKGFGKNIIVACEGKCTEKIYIETLAEKLGAKNVTVEVLKRPEGEENNSSPENVLKQLDDYVKTLKKDDWNYEYWMAIDKDKWVEKSLSTIAQSCEQKDFRLALSNPCIELWLLLHLFNKEEYAQLLDPKSELRKNVKGNVKVNTMDTFTKKKVRELLGSYKESSYDAAKVIGDGKLDIAIQRAQELDNHPQDRWPQDIGTRMYLLSQSIMDNRYY